MCESDSTNNYDKWEIFAPPEDKFKVGGSDNGVDYRTLKVQILDQNGIPLLIAGQ